MFIKSLTRFMDLMKFDAAGDAGSGGAGDSGSGSNAGTSGDNGAGNDGNNGDQGNNQGTGESSSGNQSSSQNGESNKGDEGEKPLFTQTQVNHFNAESKRKAVESFAQEMGLSVDEAKEILEKGKADKEKNQTAQEKLTDKDKEAANNKRIAEQNARMFKVVQRGVDPKDEAAVKDIVILAENRMSETVDFETALKQLEESRPTLFEATGGGNAGSQGTGSGTNPARTGRRSGQGEEKYDANFGKRLAEKKKKINKTSEGKKWR